MSSKIIRASSIEKGPEMRPEASLDVILEVMTSGKTMADGRFLGINVETSGGGLPMGEP